MPDRVAANRSCLARAARARHRGRVDQPCRWAQRDQQAVASYNLGRIGQNQAAAQLREVNGGEIERGTSGLSDRDLSAVDLDAAYSDAAAARQQPQHGTYRERRPAQSPGHHDPAPTDREDPVDGKATAVAARRLAPP